jgi:hypothetical protein
MVPTRLGLETARRESRTSGRKPEGSKGIIVNLHKEVTVLSRVATALSYIYKIAKIGVDLYSLVHFGH